MQVSAAAPLLRAKGRAALRPDMLTVELDSFRIRGNVGVKHGIGTAAVHRVGARPEIRERARVVA